jgi:hypothetical protein
MNTACSIEQFCVWLCEHEADIVGQASRCFDSPLARWLSETYGHIYGIDEKTYGRASHQWWQWQLLPQWAIAFNHRLERFAFQTITGLDALTILADVELTVSHYSQYQQAA